jgi:hypothetical protein
MNAKKLHKHSLPVVSFAMAVLALSAVISAAIVSYGQISRAALASNLTRSVISIRGTSNGTARISLSNPQTDSTKLASPDELSDAALIAIALSQANR